MRAFVQVLLLFFLSLVWLPAFASDFAYDWRTCQEEDETLALQSCKRLVANGDKSEVAYMRLGRLYEKRHELIRARESYLSAFQANPTNMEAQMQYLRLVNEPDLAIQEINQGDSFKGLKVEVPKPK